MKKRISHFFFFLTGGLILFLLGFLIFLYRGYFLRRALIASLPIPTALHAEVYTILGWNAEKKYLLALMNTSEKKPDGWFFWSYALLTIAPNSFALQFFDSYYPQTVDKVAVPLPDRFYPVMGIDTIWFLWANMLWFTDIDGKNIQQIYEETFQEKINGVLFLKYDLFHLLIPWFTSLSWKREFQNAAIDLLRNEVTGNKKELYFSDIHRLLDWKMFLTLLSNARSRRQEILSGWFIRFYSQNLSSWLLSRLQTHDMTTRYQGDCIYLYDYNLWFNKIDKFVTKKFWIRDEKTERIIWHGVDQDKKKLPDVQPGIYTLFIQYDLAVPDAYFVFMDERAQEAKITLTDREKTILSLDPQFYLRGVVYFPPQIRIRATEWDAIETKQFSTPFSQNMLYEIAGKGKNLRKTIQIEFVVK